MSDMRIGLRGPDGVRARMAEIQAKLEKAFPKESSFVDIATDASGLSGSIDAKNGGFAPFNPFGANASIRSMDAPPAIKEMIQQAAAKAGVDPQVLDALVATESAYDPNARSRAGAMGLSQLMPGTAKELGVQNPFDPMQNLNGGAAYLSKMLDRFGGDLKLALAAYNAGPGAVEKFNGIPPYAETQSYVDKIMARLNQRSAQ